MFTYLAEKRFSKIIYGSFLVIGFYTAYITTTDSWILGIGAAFLALLWFSMKKVSGLKSFLRTVFLFWLSSVLVEITIQLGKMCHANSDMFKEFLKLKMQSVMVNPFVLLIGGLIMLVGFYLIKCLEKRKQIKLEVWRIWLFGLMAVLLLSGVVCFVITNVKEEVWKGSLSCFNYLKINDNFGNGRGLIWRRTVEIYSDSSFVRKFFGCGLNCFKEYINVKGNGVPYIDAHNEFLQFLITTGILGVIGYFGLLVSSAIRDIRLVEKSPVFMMGTMVVSSFLAQGLVNNPQIITTPHLFLLLGIVKSLEQRNKN